MGDRGRAEKAEKEEEKKEEKEEKSWDEKWRRDPVSAATWAAILIWAGVVFLVDNLEVVANLPYWRAWSAVFVGAGVLLLLEVLVRLILPEYRRPVMGGVILGLIFLGIGVGDLFGWNLVWPLVLIAIGVMMLLRGLIWRR